MNEGGNIDERGGVNIDEGFSSFLLMMWGHGVEPINRCIAIHMIGRHLFALQVSINKNK